MVNTPPTATYATPSNLDPGRERELFRTGLSLPLVFCGPIVFVIVIGAAAAYMWLYVQPRELSECLAGAAVLPVVPAVLRWTFSRFIVTDRRIIMRTGWLAFASFEMLLPKVESVQVRRGVVDRVLGSGTVIVNGTGGSRETFARISRAGTFSKAATDAIESHAARLRG